jgi:tRNA/tmRNA/rRNA uracil-C5-methylase (TrmA/RlmC/RlmD family)
MAPLAQLIAGYGWSSIAIAQGYPRVHVGGYDLDEPSIARARDNARLNGVADRVRFQVWDVGDLASAGAYDLGTVFEAVHDLSDPVGALRAMRHLAGDRGTVLVVDQRVGDTF